MRVAGALNPPSALSPFAASRAENGVEKKPHRINPGEAKREHFIPKASGGACPGARVPVPAPRGCGSARRGPCGSAGARGRCGGRGWMRRRGGFGAFLPPFPPLSAPFLPAGGAGAAAGGAAARGHVLQPPRGGGSGD